MTRVRGSCVSSWAKGLATPTLLSPDARFANRFRDKHARRRRTPLYDRRGKFAGENGRRYFIPVYRCSAPPLSPCPSSLSLPASLSPSVLPVLARRRLQPRHRFGTRGCRALIEMFIALRGFDGEGVCLFRLGMEIFKIQFDLLVLSIVAFLRWYKWRSGRMKI